MRRARNQSKCQHLQATATTDNRTDSTEAYLSLLHCTRISDLYVYIQKGRGGEAFTRGKHKPKEKKMQAKKAKQNGIAKSSSLHPAAQVLQCNSKEHFVILRMVSAREGRRVLFTSGINH